ncbi:MAG TPA: glycosyltransferase [Anaerolineaceae bacterium]
MITPSPALVDFDRYTAERRAHWEKIAERFHTHPGWGGYYHHRLSEIYRQLITPGQRVLELGCGLGNLLAALQPSLGVGVDFSDRMISLARKHHPEASLRFVLADAHDLSVLSTLPGPVDEPTPFDAIILSDLLNDAWDVQTILEQVARLAHPGTRLIINSYSRLWEQPLALAQRLGLAQPTLTPNWLTVEDITNLAELGGFEVFRRWHEVLWPLPTPGLDALCNRYLVRFLPFQHLALANLIVARPAPIASICPVEATLPSVSVIVPARNEAGNIPQIFARCPEMGSQTELIFVEGHSSDSTYAAIEAAIATNPNRPTRLFRQTGIGKGDAVRLGFTQARGDIVMILDADLTVLPEDLPRFYKALCSGKGEFINGVRMVYPMEKQAMRFLNFLGNKFFSLAFSWLLGQPIKDTLCGTKALWRADYEKIAANRAYFGDFDPFGDFDLLFGAVRLCRKIIDLPVRYRERTYGTTNIQRWKHGWLLLKMVAIAAGRLKFI